MYTAKCCSTLLSKSLHIYSLLFLTHHCSKSRHHNFLLRFLLTSSRLMDQYAGFLPSNSLPTVYSKSYSSKMHGINQLPAVSAKPTLCLHCMILELEVYKLHFPASLATGFLLDSVDWNQWQETRRQTWREDTLFSSFCQALQ
jgi:hypothetical protein